MIPEDAFPILIATIAIFGTVLTLLFGVIIFKFNTIQKQTEQALQKPKRKPRAPKVYNPEKDPQQPTLPFEELQSQEKEPLVKT